MRQSKLDHPALAKDLYCSRLWNARRASAEATGDEWLILSAMHGLIDPTQRLEPYDLELKSLPDAERGARGVRVVEELERRFGRLVGMRYELHAGGPYRRA